MWARVQSAGSRDDWWAGRESNPHSRRRLVYSQRSSPPAQPTHWTGDGSRDCGPSWCTHLPGSSLGADDGTRTRNLRVTKPLLYQLSYVGAAQGHTAETLRRRGMIRSGRLDGQATGAAAGAGRGPDDGGG